METGTSTEEIQIKELYYSLWLHCRGIWKFHKDNLRMRGWQQRLYGGLQRALPEHKDSMCKNIQWCFYEAQLRREKKNRSQVRLEAGSSILIIRAVGVCSLPGLTLRILAVTE